MLWRSLRRTPGFTVAAVLLLAIGIGGAALLFSVVDALLLRPIAAPRPGELARVVELIPGRPPTALTGWDELQEFRARTRSFAVVFAEAQKDFTMGEGDGARLVSGAISSPEFFDVLHVRPALGHLASRPDEVLLTDTFWKSAFQADRTVVGRAIRLDGRPFTVAGVLPRGFNGVQVETGAQLRFPFASVQLLAKKGDPNWFGWDLAGRLRPGLTPESATRESSEAMHAALIAAAAKQKPLTEDARSYIEHQRFQVESLEHGVSRLRDRFGSSLIALFGGAILLLLLACTNIAGMMVARAASREREMALRAALGATRMRLVRLWIAESGAIALMGGVAALLLLAFALPAVAGHMPPLRDLGTNLVPVALDLRIDLRVFGFAFLLCGVAALLAGMAPAWHASRVTLIGSLKTTAGDPRRARLRGVLTVVQVAICTVVLANSALLVATLNALRTAPTGFDRDHLVTFTIETTATSDVAVRLEQEARALPGVDNAALASRSLMRGSGFKNSVGLPGTRNGRDLNASNNVVSPAYFEAMGIRLLEGRNLSPGDGVKDRKPRPVVVNQAFVQRFFPSTNPIGRTYGIGFDRVLTPDYEIVGVVSNTRYRSLREPFQPISYACFCDAEAIGHTTFQLEVRTARPEAVIGEVRSLMSRLAPGVPFREVRTMAQDVDDSLWAERTLAAIGTSFAIIAALVAALGLYGLLAYTLAERRRELGIRIALGAGRANIARAVLLRVLLLVVAGAVIGTAAALWTGRQLAAILWDVKPADPRIHLLVWALLLATAALAAALPAWRAARTDPAQTLREN